MKSYQTKMFTTQCFNDINTVHCFVRENLIRVYVSASATMYFAKSREIQFDHNLHYRITLIQQVVSTSEVKRKILESI